MVSHWLSSCWGLGYHFGLVVFAVHVVMKRRSVGVTLAWLVLLFAVPVVGVICYVMFGTRRLGGRRVKRAKVWYPDYFQWCAQITKAVQSNNFTDIALTVKHPGVYRLAECVMGIPVLPGNYLQIYHTPADILTRLIDDIKNSKHCIVMAFYILEPKGRILTLMNALISAAHRGVKCVVLLDAVGSHQFFKSEWVLRFNESGITVTAAFPVGVWRVMFGRMDIRNHRKILMVDEQIAWTGSFNLVDPEFFKQDAHVGEWIDAMVRIEGVAPHILGTIIQWDEALETGKKPPTPEVIDIYKPIEYPELGGATPLHVVPSGPDNDSDAMHQILLMSIYESQEELIISTPYFIPDEALVTAMKSAALRGVKVKLLVPKKNNSKMVYHASRAYYEEILASGVEIHQFVGGLLHTKCVLIDQSTALFGTVNLDMRSVWLNFEVTLVVYDEEFGRKMYNLMQSYLQQAVLLDEEKWLLRPASQKLLENTAQLLAPLL